MSKHQAFGVEVAEERGWYAVMDMERVRRTWVASKYELPHRPMHDRDVRSVGPFKTQADAQAYANEQNGASK